ncbi:sensor histidine kinase [Paenibacillus azoreducens]|uniref:Histidine kinase/HSP90-like ATPase domain-containing protein n=1 Tax=Paenibacillus azoreducens TaxID=116718 RepID=A0A919YJ52_9BACL|nr:ATP-binding protein [Paenibacillus azoreducens]GIO51449.1 hypothetical protein J34TS1_62140 [Paenibacillus azoreducens]
MAGGKGDIHIRVYSDEAHLIYEVHDNGAGLDPKEMQRLMINPEKENRGSGVKNVNDRIKLYFGNEYGLFFEWNPEQGTTVTANQPKNEKMQHD